MWRQISTGLLRPVFNDEFLDATELAVLLVTSVSSRERACAAMKRSFAPIMVPRALSAARIWA